MSLHRTTTAGSICRDGLAPLDVNTASDAAINDRLGHLKILDAVLRAISEAAEPCEDAGEDIDPSNDYRSLRLDGEELQQDGN